MLYFKYEDRKRLYRTSITVGDSIAWNKVTKSITLQREGVVLLWPTKIPEKIVAIDSAMTFMHYAEGMAAATAEHLDIEQVGTLDGDIITYKFVTAH